MSPISFDFIEGIKRSAFAGDDVFGGLAPEKGLRLGVVLQEVVVDLVLEIIDAGIATATDAPVVISAKNRSTRFSQDGLVGGKCNLKGCVAKFVAGFGWAVFEDIGPPTRRTARARRQSYFP